MILRILLPLLFAASPALAAPFVPQTLQVRAPDFVMYEFDGSTLTIPLILEGGPASVTLALFTNYRASSIRDIRSGHLGWHYVNAIDTCFHISRPYSMTPGQNTIPWDGKDDDGQTVPAGDYTYYLWGMGTGSTTGNACVDPRFVFSDRATVVTYDEQGTPLANPVLFSTAQFPAPSGETWNIRSRWTLGGDPEDASLLETTRYRSYPDRGRMALSPVDLRLFFTQALEPGALVTRAWQWTPNGDAVLRTGWGENGKTAIPSALDPETASWSGPVNVNEDYLFSTGYAPGGPESHPMLDGFDIVDGTHIKQFDLSPWFSPYVLPTELAYGAGMLLLSSPGANIFQMVNPVGGMDDADSFARWGNGEGDGFADVLPAPGAPRGMAVDRDGFSLFAENGAAPSVGAFTPDGTGLGAFPLPGMTGGIVTGIHIIHTGSMFDGIYTDSATGLGVSAGVRYTGYDVFKGHLTSQADYFGPTFRFTMPLLSHPLQPGSTVAISWENPPQAPQFGLVVVSVSFDDRQTWTALADSAVSTGSLDWTVPSVSSAACWLRVKDFFTGDFYAIWGPFAIEGPVAVSDDAPRVFGLLPNTPNPFNPSTTLSFTLPAPGNVSLTVYDATGRKVTELAHGFHAAVEHTAVWNAKGCASGVYFAVLKAGERTETRKMLLVR